MFQREIKYDRHSKDFAMLINGECVGYARTFQDAETALDTLIHELLTHAQRAQ